MVALIQPISYEKDARNTVGISKTLPAVDSATSVATMSSDSEDTEENETWIQWFCRLKGNEFFCEVRLCFFDTLPPSPPPFSCHSPSSPLPRNFDGSTHLKHVSIIAHPSRHWENQLRICKIHAKPALLSQVDKAYIEDGFNLYGLRQAVSNFQDSLDIILDRNGKK